MTPAIYRTAERFEPSICPARYRVPHPRIGDMVARHRNRVYFATWKATRKRKPLSVRTLYRALQRKLPWKDRRPTPMEVTTLAAGLGRYPLEKVRAKCRTRDISAIRTAAVAYCRALGYSFPAIAEGIGATNHTTAISMYRRFERELPELVVRCRKAVA